MKSLIELQNISSKAGQKYLLHDVNWQVKQGERWIVFGENGSGKTTLLSVIAGYKKYTAGFMKLFGESYQQAKVLEYRKKIGLVSTSFFSRILRNESVQNIVLSGKTGTLGIGAFLSNLDLVRSRQLMEKFRISTKKDMPFYLLSKGEQQSVLLARAFMGKPELLLLDEADSGLDYVARIRLYEFLNMYAIETDSTIITVTHYPDEIPDFYEHCLLMKRGRVYRHGRISEIFRSEIFTDFLQYPVEVKKQTQGYQFVSKGGELSICRVMEDVIRQ